VEGQRFGRYRLERQIGSGGMGDVYEAADLDRDRLVALKLLPELFSNNDEFEQRFRRESRLAARLRDPHIIPIHDYGEIDGRLYIDMRLVEDGATLASVLRDEGSLSPDRAVRLLVQIAEGLDSAHGEGLIHRDVKPSNVMVTPRDFVYIIDFGIAHAAGETRAGLTGTGSTIGTLDYMAPERFTNSHTDARADIYSLACLLYQCLTGQRPFRGDLPRLMGQHLSAEPPRPSDLVPGTPEGLDAVVARGMAKKPDDRYPTAGALAEAAWQAVEEAGQLERRPSRPTRPNREKRSSPSVAVPAPTAELGSNGTKPEAADRGPAETTPGEAGTHEHPARTGMAPTLGSGTRPDRPDADDTELVHDGQGAAEPVTATNGSGSAHGSPSSPASMPPPSGPSPTAGSPQPAPDSGARPHSWKPVAIIGVLLVLAVAVFGAVTALRATSQSAANPSQDTTPAQIAPVASDAVPEVTGSIPTPPTPGAMAITPDGRYGYVTNRGPRAVTVIDLASRSPVGTIPMPAPPRFVAFDEAGTRAYVSCYDDAGTVAQVVAVDVQTLAATAAIPVDKQPYALALAPDQRTLWVPSHGTGSIDLVDTESNTVTRRVPVPQNPHGVIFAGQRAYVVNHESNLLTVLDAGSAAIVTTIPTDRSPHAAAASPDGSRVAVANYEGNTVSMVDTATNQVAATVAVGQGPQSVAYAPDGRYLYTANVNEGSVSVIEAATNQVTATVPVGTDPTSVTPAPDGRLAYVTLLDESRLVTLSIAR
jgi:YVTN family beta-propeller protein